MTTIPCPHCLLRPWHEGDAESLIWNADDVRVSSMMREDFPSPFTYKEAEAWIARAAQQVAVFDFAIVPGDDPAGEAVGGVSLRIGEGEHREFGELSFWLGHEFWGQGLATEAVEATIAYAAMRFELRRLYALVFADNLAAARVLEKNGFALQGRIEEGIRNRGQLQIGRAHV